MSRIWLGIFLCNFLFLSANAAVKASKEKAPLEVIVAVDCSIGESINDALATPAQNLIIEISGKCAEDVVVDRSNVTFRGSDPLLDEIRPDPDGLMTNALALRNVSNIRLENLTLTGAGTALIGINDSFGVSLTNCNLLGVENVDPNDSTSRSTFAGAIVGTASGSVYFQNTDFSNLGLGLWVTNGSWAMCAGCEITDADVALRASTGAKLEIGDRSSGGQVWTRPNSFEHNPATREWHIRAALLVSDQSTAVASRAFNSTYTTELTGNVIVENNSFASLSHVNNSEVTASSFSGVLLGTGSSLSSLQCLTGSDAVCGDATGLGDTGCGQCTAPASTAP